MVSNVLLPAMFKSVLSTCSSIMLSIAEFDLFLLFLGGCGYKGRIKEPQNDCEIGFLNLHNVLCSVIQTMKASRSGLGSWLNHAFLSSPRPPSHSADFEHDAHWKLCRPKHHSLIESYLPIA